MPTGDELAQLEALLQREPRSPEFHRLADAYTRAGRFLEAAGVCRIGLKVHPQLVDGYVALGRALFGAGHLPKAVQVLRRCLSLKNPTAETYRLLAEVLLWQEVPGEALAVLEEAEGKGFQERTLRSLLERARAALDAQRTGVVTIPERLRGIGNVAVAGTIGDSAAEPSGRPDGPAAKRDVDLFATSRMDPSPPLRAKPRPQAMMPGPPPADENRWGSLDDMWTRELDAHVQPFPDVESDPGVARVRQPVVDLELAPLVDPLAEGMPPLPSEAEDSGVKALPRSEAGTVDDDLSEETSRVQRSSWSSVRSGRAEEELATLGPEVATPSPSLATPSLELATPSLELATPSPSLATPSLELATPSLELATPSPPEIPPAPPRQAPSSPVLAALQPEGSAPRRVGSRAERAPTGLSFDATGTMAGAVSNTDAGPDLQLLQALATPPSQDGAPLLEEVPDSQQTGRARPARASRRRHGVGFWVAVCLLCAGTGAGGVFLHQRFFSTDQLVRRLLDRAAVARARGSAEEYAAMAASLDGAARRQDDGRTLRAEADLMRALAWLEYRAGERPAARPQVATWPEALAQAAAALADNNAHRALAFLEGVPRDPGNQGLRAWMAARARWLQGDPREAEAQLTEARRLIPELAGADVLEGCWRRESGDLGAAERAFRQALGRSPRHEVAAAGLVAVLLGRDPKAAELETLMSRAPMTPIGTSWRRLLLIERRFLLGDDGAVADLPALVAAMPTSPALLFHGVEVLGRAGRFLEANTELMRLRKVRGKADPALQLLESELLIAQGLEPLALERLRGASGPAARRLRAWALVLTGRGAEVAPELSGETEDEALQPLRLLAAALKDPASPSRTLADLARGSPEGQLALVTLLLARGLTTEAMAAAKQLGEWPLLRLRAQLIEAQLLVNEGRIGAATELLLAVQRRSPGHLGALELLGRLELARGNPQGALELLEAARQAQRRTPALTEAWIKALALVGRAGEAAAELERARSSQVLEPRLVGLLADYLEVAQGRPVNARGRAAQDLPLLVAQGDLLLKLGRAKEAEKVWLLGQARDPKHPLPQLKLGSLAAARGKPDAISHFDRAIEAARGDAHYPRQVLALALAGKARYYLARKDALAAIGPARAAMEVGVEQPLACRVLSEALLAARRYPEAREALARRSKLDPSDADALYLLGTAARAGRAQTREALQRFLQLKPTGKRAALVRRLLKRAR